MGTAYWYNGEPDTAIAQFQKAHEPTKVTTLFNLGIGEFQRKHAAKAVAAWQRLLGTNPGYENKEKVLPVTAQAQNR